AHTPGGAQEAAAEKPAPALPAEAPEQITGLAFRHIQEQFARPVVREALRDRKVLGIGLVTLVGLLFFLGAMGKSAQIPLYVWLPDAMAGPTPVSALIHAATMVTAGVYMVARLHFIFALSPFLMTWVTLVGAITAVFAATIGFFQYDIKKVLAYSTVSQLGFMFIAVGVGAYGVGIFHLMTHAFFKACLFLGSGSVILGCHHEQDMRKMGGLRKLMPVTAATYFAACCAIAGFPLTAGFFSKDEILWKAFDAGNLLLPGGGVMVWALAAVGALCTSFYMFRSYYMTFSGEYRGGAPAHGHGADPDADLAGHDAGHGHAGHPAALPHESPASMTGVLAALAVLSLLGGLIGLPHVWHLPNYLHHWLEPVFEESAGWIASAGHGARAEWTLMAVSVCLALGGWLLARWLYCGHTNPLPQRLLDAPNPFLRRAYRLVFNKYYVDEIYAALVVAPVLRLRLICDWFDRRVVDGLVNLAGPVARGLAWLHGATDTRIVDGAVNGTASLIQSGGQVLRRLQTGNIQTYLYAIVLGGIALVLTTYLLIP
ncbi:MAG: NADH-quinone oxidoreductase subunit L, partial [bacterium]